MRKLFLLVLIVIWLLPAISVSADLQQSSGFTVRASDVKYTEWKGIASSDFESDPTVRAWGVMVHLKNSLEKTAELSLDPKTVCVTDSVGKSYPLCTSKSLGFMMAMQALSSSPQSLDFMARQVLSSISEKLFRQVTWGWNEQDAIVVTFSTKIASVLRLVYLTDRTVLELFETTNSDKPVVTVSDFLAEKLNIEVIAGQEASLLILFDAPVDKKPKELLWPSSKPLRLEPESSTPDSSAKPGTDGTEAKSQLPPYNTNKREAKAHKERGATYVMEGKYDKAIEEFSNAISLDFSDAEAYTARGFVYRRKGQYDKAIEDFNIAVKLDPKTVDAIFNRGHCYVEKGEYEKAIEDFSKTISLNPNLSEAYNNRGLCYRKLGNNDKAMKDYTKAIEVDPKNGEAYNNRGVIYITSENIEKAISDFQKACDFGSQKGCRNLQKAKQERGR